MSQTNVLTADFTIDFAADTDIWVDSCHLCGSFENFGDLECSRCDLHR